MAEKSGFGRLTIRENTMRTDLSIVIPLFNSEDTVRSVLDEVIYQLHKAGIDPEIILVNDGSNDGTDSIVRGFIQEHKRNVTYIQLAKNFGEHNAVMCGLAHSTKEMIVIMDDDGQNPPEEINKLLARLEDGYDVVYASYDQKQHSWLRNSASRITGETARYFLGKPKELYLSSFKALRRGLALNILQYKGPFPHLDSILFKQTDAISSVQCAHRARAEGKSNYNFRRLFSLWLNMVTVSSVMPLRLASIFGLIMSATGASLAFYFILSWAVGGIWYEAEFPQGWASLITCITLFSGVQLLMLGIMGEYIGKMYVSASSNPQYVIRTVIKV